MKLNRFVVPILMLVAIGFAAIGATNFVKEADVVRLTWATTSPSASSAVVKGTSKANGAIIGVALNGTGTASENVSVKTSGVFLLPVQASSTVGNIAVGDYVYTTMSGVEVCTTQLSNINTGILFGKAMEAITATTTAGVYSTIKVMLCQPGHL